MPFVRYMWGHFASGAEKKKRGRGGRERAGTPRVAAGARCGPAARPGGRSRSLGREKPSPSAPAGDICQGRGHRTLIRPRQRHRFL